MPSRSWEKKLFNQGYRFIAGIDEAGRGALAGPVVAAAVILPLKIAARKLAGVDDSKKLSPERREKLFPLIKQNAIATGVGIVSHEYIDRRNILRATEYAMKLAVEQLTPQPDWLLIDFLKLPDITMGQTGITHGDSLCFSIAAASIIAKVTRDHILIEMEDKYPGYGFAQNKGYGTPEHLECLDKLGPCEIHRRTFSPLSQLRLALEFYES